MNTHTSHPPPHPTRSALRKAEDIYTQLVRFMGHPCPPGLGLPLATCGDETTPLRRALTAGLFPHAARLQPDGSYRVIATGRQVGRRGGCGGCGGWNAWRVWRVRKL